MTESPRDESHARGDSKRRALAVMAVLFGFTALAAGAFWWMAKEGLERAGSGSYSGAEALLEEGETVEGVRPR